MARLFGAKDQVGREMSGDRWAGEREGEKSVWLNRQVEGGGGGGMGGGEQGAVGGAETQWEYEKMIFVHCDVASLKWYCVGTCALLHVCACEFVCDCA